MRQTSRCPLKPLYLMNIRCSLGTTSTTGFEPLATSICNSLRLWGLDVFHGRSLNQNLNCCLRGCAKVIVFGGSLYCFPINPERIDVKHLPNGCGHSFNLYLSFFSSGSWAPTCIDRLIFSFHVQRFIIDVYCIVIVLAIVQSLNTAWESIVGLIVGIHMSGNSARICSICNGRPHSGHSVRMGKVSMFTCYRVCSTIPCTTMLSGSAGACRCWSKRSTCYHITSYVLIPRLSFLGVHIQYRFTGRSEGADPICA